MKKWFTGHPIEITTFKANAILKTDIFWIGIWEMRYHMVMRKISARWAL